MLTLRVGCTLGSLLPALVLSGCGDGARVITTPEGFRDAAYLGSVSVQLPGSDYSSYTALVREVGDTTNDSLRAGLETPGWLAPKTYEGAIYIPNHEAATLTRFTTAANGALIQGETLSFASFGITWVAPTFVASDKAYMFDDTNLQIIVFNPQTMSLTGDLIDVSELLQPPIADKPGFWPAMLSDYGRARGDRLFVPVRWTNWDAADSFVPSAGLLVVDTTNDSPVKLLQDDRLADTIYTVMTESEDIYLFTGALGVVHNYVRGTARPGGALRVRGGQEEFDPNFYVDLNQAVGGRPASTPVWSNGTSVYLKAFHSEQQPLDASLEAEPGGLLARAAWHYWEVDLEGAAPAREITELPWTSTDGFFYDLRDGGPLFIGVMSADFATTTLYEATPAGFQRSIDVTGVLQVLAPLDR